MSFNYLCQKIALMHLDFGNGIIIANTYLVTTRYLLIGLRHDIKQSLKFNLNGRERSSIWGKINTLYQLETSGE